MHPEIELRWNALVDARIVFTKKLSEMPADKLNVQPDQGWSVIQVMEHLLFSETGTLGYMKKKSSAGWDKLEVTGQEQNSNSDALNARLISPAPYKAPAILPEPKNIATMEELMANWEITRNEMKEFVNTVDPVHFDKLVFRQPIAGMLNVLQTLEFLGHHIHHHIPQLERISIAINR